MDAGNEPIHHPRWSNGFVRIARQHYDAFLKVRERIRILEATPFSTEDNYQELDHEIGKCKDELSNHGLIVIVFAACAVEANIYDYAARRFSDNFVPKYLDKLETTAKWVVYPQMVTGKRVDTGDNALNLLGKLISKRNQVVHYKSSDVDFDNLTPERIEQQEQSFIMAVMDAIRAIDELAAFAEKLDPDDPLFFFGLC